MTCVDIRLKFYTNPKRNDELVVEMIGGVVMLFCDCSTLMVVKAIAVHGQYFFL